MDFLIQNIRVEIGFNGVKIDTKNEKTRAWILDYLEKEGFINNHDDAFEVIN